MEPSCQLVSYLCGYINSSSIAVQSHSTIHGMNKHFIKLVAS